MTDDELLARDCLVGEAIGHLDDVDADRALAEMAAFVAHQRAHPDRFGDVDFEIERCAVVRELDGDPTAPTWLAWVTARRLRRQCEELWRQA